MIAPAMGDPHLWPPATRPLLAAVLSNVTFTNVHQGRSYGYSFSGPKWKCDVCGRTGYSNGNPAGRPLRTTSHGHWSDSCRRGHAPCPWCGRVLALRKDGTPRVHSRCPDRPDDAELLRSAEREARDIARRGVRGPMTRDSRNLLNRLTTNPEET